MDCYLDGVVLFLCLFCSSWAVFSVTEGSRSTSKSKVSQSGCYWGTECREVNTNKPTPWEEGTVSVVRIIQSVWPFSIFNILYFLKQLFAVSKKVHTTRSSALGVITEDDTQIVSLCYVEEDTCCQSFVQSCIVISKYYQRNWIICFYCLLCNSMAASVSF